MKRKQLGYQEQLRQRGSNYDLDEEEDVDIHRDGLRDQIVSHYHSSLQNPNIENIEALLVNHITLTFIAKLLFFFF